MFLSRNVRLFIDLSNTLLLYTFKSKIWKSIMIIKLFICYSDYFLVNI